MGLQTSLFLKLAVHRLDRVFSGLDSALGELPSVFADAFAPKDLTAIVYQNDADIGPVAVLV
jgi:hypothetical protein